MSLEIRTDVPLKPMSPVYPDAVPGAVYWISELDCLVAVSSDRKPTIHNTMSCSVSAWLVDAEGDAQAMASLLDRPIAVSFKHNASIEEVGRLGVQGIVRALIALVMGEPAGESPAIPWGESVRSTVNIRHAITLAKAMSETVGFSVLPVRAPGELIDSAP